MNKFSKIFLFLFLLILSNLYLLRPGFWFYQDAGFWPKTNYEAMTLLLRQFHIFTNLGYYMGSDQGLLSFTSVLVTGSTSFVFYIFRQNNSQIVFTFAGYILSFVSFYLFSGVFFKEKRLRYILSLVYVFNPWSYMTQGYVFYNATVPLFIYSFYKYFFNTEGFRAKYLLLNIFAAYIWVAYIRFIQGYSFIIIPYLLYLAFRNRKEARVKKIVIYVFSCLLVFAPIIFAFVSQLLEKSNTAFNYGSIFGNSVVKDKMYDAFNLFQSVGAKLYQGKWWSILGLAIFAYITYLIATFSKKKHSGFYLLNLLLVLVGITMYGLGNIFGNAIYLKVIHLLPFIINEPYWAMSILGVPIVVLIGLLTKERIKYLYIFAFFFIALATLPLLNLSDFQLQKYNLDSAPAAYQTYFITPYSSVPEASYYFLGDCWRAEFMNEANVPTFCINYDQHYPTIIFNNPRVVSGETLDISQFLYVTTHVNNLRITHNLKDIFVPNDIVGTKGPGPITGEKEIEMAKNANLVFGKNKLLLADSNPNFTYYTFVNKDKYDFLIYSPKTVIYSQNFNILTDDSLDINTRPVVLPNNALQIPDAVSNVKIEYKISPLEPYKYYLHVTNIDNIHSFLIQFNQMYSFNWKIKLVSKAYFDVKSCISGWKVFPVTNNSYCQYQSSLLDLDNITLLGKGNISDSKHFQGNFVGNTWVVSPQDSQGKSELYLVIIYAKQVYYIYTILIAGIALIILFTIYIVQEIQRKIIKRKIFK
jgi:hypothetical protein